MAVSIPDRVTPIRVVALWFALLPTLVSAAADATVPPAAVVKQLLQRDLTSDSQREALLLTVEYGPGGASLPHRHDAQVFVYVLEGTITMQVKGGAPVTLRAGETFYEGVSDVHVVSANASQTQPAKILVFMIKQKGKPATRGVAETATP